MENNNVMPEILENDLIKTWSKVWNVGKVKEEFAYDISANITEDGKRIKSYVNKLYYDYKNYKDSYYSYISLVDDILESITAIYRKVGKDYICIWEKI